MVFGPEDDASSLSKHNPVSPNMLFLYGLRTFKKISCHFKVPCGVLDNTLALWSICLCARPCFVCLKLPSMVSHCSTDQQVVGMRREMQQCAKAVKKKTVRWMEVSSPMFQMSMQHVCQMSGLHYT